MPIELMVINKPKNLPSTECKIKKYHSGLIWVDVLNIIVYFNCNNYL